jgi:glucan phosphoethanolaminetransferase (alkaline phosphatase superfamily)
MNPRSPKGDKKISFYVEYFASLHGIIVRFLGHKENYSGDYANNIGVFSIVITANCVSVIEIISYSIFKYQRLTSTLFFVLFFLIFIFNVFYFIQDDIKKDVYRVTKSKIKKEMKQYILLHLAITVLLLIFLKIIYKIYS